MSAVDQLTLVGDAELKRGNENGALQTFKSALSLAKNKHMDEAIIHTCTVNLGTAYIAVRRAKEGINILRTVLAKTGSNHRVCGDVYYNIAWGYNLLNDNLEAIRYMEMALTEYENMPNRRWEIEAVVHCHLSEQYESLGQLRDAARQSAIATACYKSQGDIERTAICLLRQSNQLEKGQYIEESCAAADECLAVCQQHSGRIANLGQVYNELGLQYVKCHRIDKAQTCFKLILDLHLCKDKKSEAIVRQNIGAIQNCLSNFSASVEFNKSAAFLHAQCVNRNPQGQCFLNMAYAFSQLGDIESARDYYLHAHLAATDTNDNHCKWNALEGLAAIAFNRKQFDQCLDYLKTCLTTLSISDSEEDEEVQNRIVGKLSVVLQSLAGPHGDTEHKEIMRARPSRVTTSPVANQTKHSTTFPTAPMTTASTSKSLSSSQIVSMDTIDRGDVGKDYAGNEKRLSVHTSSKQDLISTLEVDDNDKKLVNDYRRQVELVDNNSTSEEDSDSESSDGEVIVPQQRSFPMRTVPLQIQQPSSIKGDTYIDPLHGTSSTTATLEQGQDREPLYATIQVKESPPPTLPARRDHDQITPMDAITKDQMKKKEAEGDTTAGSKEQDLLKKIGDEPTSAPKVQKKSQSKASEQLQSDKDSSACLIM